LKHLVFVYGTLKSNEPNHSVILTSEGCGESVLVGRGLTRECFPLVIASRYNIPYLLDAPGRGSRIHGQIYRVDDDKLRVLDILEGVPDHYVRRQVPVDVVEPGHEQASHLTCWLYIQENFKPQLLELPFISDYCLDTYKEKPYVPRSQRERDEERSKESKAFFSEDIKDQ